MKLRMSRLRSLRGPLVVGAVLAVGGALSPLIAGASAATATTTLSGTSGTVLQTNMVSDLPGVASLTDPNLVNPWGVAESTGSPFWISDNNSGFSTLYQVPAATPTSASIEGLVVNIPTPVSSTGGAPTGDVFNTGAASGAFPVTGLNSAGVKTTAPADFLFDTEDGTILGWSPTIDATHAIIAVDNSGNNFTNPNPNEQTGAVYKGLAIATSSTPIIASDPNSTSLLYASNFRAGTIEVYDGTFQKVTLPAGAFRDRSLPAGYAPFDVQVLNGQLYVTYAKQDATKHDDAAGPHRGFVDVFNLNGTPGLPGGRVRLITRGPLDSPWGLAIAPTGFAGLTAPNGDPVLLVGNFGNGLINAFDASTGSRLGRLTDSDGEPIDIDGLWALRVGNGGNGGASNTVYFTAGLFSERHGLLGALTTAAPGSPEGPAEGQWVTANVDLVQLDQQQLAQDASSGASVATIRADAQTLIADSRQLARVEQAYARDVVQDATR
jgi:uncharacterized protein (TIGR03118 family)